MRILALDYGAARCGCALSDPSGTLATPIGVVEDPGTERGMAEIARLAAEHGVDFLLLGLPVGLSGNEGEQAAEVRRFGDQLGKVVSVPIELYDERFTTKLAEGDEGRAPEDSRAAAHLLTSYLRSREVAPPGPIETTPPNPSSE